MAREYQTMRDRNILNSWEKGGKFEGRQATDQMLLKHLQDRKAGLDPDDPMYDEASQRLTEYKFSIDNSKMELRYAEGKVSDLGMAAFYNKASRTLPQNSEAWRNMRMLAAQYKDRAKTAGGGGGGRGGSRGGYNSDANNIPQKKEVAYNTMIGMLTQVALAEGILNTERESLQDLRVAEGDASRFVQLLEILNTDDRYAQLRKDNTAYIRQWGNPGFSGNFTFDTLQAERKNWHNGLSSRINAAQRGGHATDTKKFTKEMEESNGVFNTIVAATPLKRYEDARDLLDLRTLDNPMATSLDRYLALQDYGKELQSIHGDMSQMDLGDAKIAANLGHLNNEILGLTGGEVDPNYPTLMEDSRGTVAGYKQQGGGVAGQQAEIMAGLRKEVELLVTGAGVNMLVDEAGMPTDNHEIGVYKVVPTDKVEPGSVWVPSSGHLPPSIDFEGQTVSIAGVMTAILATRVYTQPAGPVDITGRPTDTSAVPKENTNIANIFTMPDGTRLAQYWDTNGTKRYTSDPESLFESPEGVRLQTQETREGLMLTVQTGGKGKYDPYWAMNADMRDPTYADNMVNKVGRSAFTQWLNSTRSADTDPGMAYAMDPRVAAQAITRELGTAKPDELLKALNEAEMARTDYLANTPDIDRRIRAAAANNRTGTIADKAMQEGYADMAGLSRDVEDMYGRARTDQIGQNAFERRLSMLSGSAEFLEENERDVLVRAALRDDPNERAYIAALMAGGNRMPPGVAATMRAQQSKGIVPPVGPYHGQRRPEAETVAAFKALTAQQLAGTAGALASTIRPPAGPLAPTGGAGFGALPSGGFPSPTGGLPGARPPTPPAPKIAPPKAPVLPPHIIPTAPPPPPGFNPGPINSGSGTFYYNPKTGQKAYT